MPSVYLDEDVSVGLADRLTAAGHPATTARDQRLTNARDYIQMLVAWERQSVIVTHNQKDFVELYETWQTWPRRWGMATPPSHPGVIVLEQRPVGQLVAPLLEFFDNEHPRANSLYRWRAHLGWQRWTPSSDWQAVSRP